MPRRKRPISVYANPAVAERLYELAEERDLSLSQVAEDLIREALEARELVPLRRQIEERFEAVVTRILARSLERVVYLCATAALEAGTARLMVAADLASRVGQERAKQLADEARKLAARRLKAPDELLREILAQHSSHEAGNS